MYGEMYKIKPLMPKKGRLKLPNAGPIKNAISTIMTNSGVP